MAMGPMGLLGVLMTILWCEGSFATLQPEQPERHEPKSGAGVMSLLDESMQAAADAENEGEFVTVKENRVSKSDPLLALLESVSSDSPGAMAAAATTASAAANADAATAAASATKAAGAATTAAGAATTAAGAATTAVAAATTAAAAATTAAAAATTEEMTFPDGQPCHDASDEDIQAWCADERVTSCTSLAQADLCTLLPAADHCPASCCLQSHCFPCGATAVEEEIWKQADNVDEVIGNERASTAEVHGKNCTDSEDTEEATFQSALAALPTLAHAKIKSCADVKEAGLCGSSLMADVCPLACCLESGCAPCKWAEVRGRIEHGEDRKDFEDLNSKMKEAEAMYARREVTVYEQESAPSGGNVSADLTRMRNDLKWQPLKTAKEAQINQVSVQELMLGERMASQLHGISTFYAACIQGSPDCTKFQTAMQEIKHNTDELKKFLESQNSSIALSKFNNFTSNLQKLETMHIECTTGSMPHHCTSAIEFQNEVNSTNTEYGDMLHSIAPREALQASDEVVVLDPIVVEMMNTHMANGLHDLCTFYAACVQGSADCHKFEAARQEIRDDVDRLTQRIQKLDSPATSAKFNSFSSNLQRLDNMHHNCMAANCTSVVQFKNEAAAAKDAYAGTLRSFPALTKPEKHEHDATAVDLLSSAARARIKWGSLHWHHRYHNHHGHCPHRHGAHSCWPSCYGCTIFRCNRCCCRSTGSKDHPCNAPWYRSCWPTGNHCPHSQCNFWNVFIGETCRTQCDLAEIGEEEQKLLQDDGGLDNALDARRHRQHRRRFTSHESRASALRSAPTVASKVQELYDELRCDSSTAAPLGAVDHPADAPQGPAANCTEDFKPCYALLIKAAAPEGKLVSQALLCAAFLRFRTCLGSCANSTDVVHHKAVSLKGTNWSPDKSEAQRNTGEIEDKSSQIPIELLSVTGEVMVGWDCG